jgi:hypothetical protein
VKEGKTAETLQQEGTSSGRTVVSKRAGSRGLCASIAVKAFGTLLAGSKSFSVCIAAGLANDGFSEIHERRKADDPFAFLTCRAILPLRTYFGSGGLRANWTIISLIANESVLGQPFDGTVVSSRARGAFVRGNKSI